MNNAKIRDNHLGKLLNYEKGFLFLLYILILNGFYLYSIKQKINTQNLFKKYIIISLILNFIIIIVYYYNKRFQGNLIKKFILILGIFGSIGIFITPLFGTPDEVAHYLRAYEISKGHLLSQTDGYSGGREMPENINFVISKIDPNNLYYSTIKNLINIETTSNKNVFLSFTNTCLYSPVQYIPQAVGMFLTNLFTNKIILIGYGGRIVNFLVCFFIYLFAMNLLPKFRKYLFLIVFMPMNLQLMTSLSSDALTTALSILLICLTVKVAFFNDNSVISIKEKLFIYFACVMLSLCKIVYLPICLIILLIPTSKFRSLKDRVIYILSTAYSSLILNLSWLIYSKRFLVNLRENVNPKLQFSGIIHSPFNFVFIIINTIKEYSLGWITTMIGSNLNWLNNNLPIIYIIIYIAFFIYFLLVDNCLIGIIGKKTSNIALIILVLCILLIHTSLYIQWSDVGSSVVNGIQGRYLIPLLGLLPLLVGKKLDENENSLNESLSNWIIYLYSGVFLHCFIFNLF